MIHFLIKQKVRFQRGQTWLQMGNFIMLLFLTLREINLGFSSIGFGVIIILFGLWLIGFVDQKFRIQQREAEYLSSAINPYFSRIEKKINKIGELVDYEVKLRRHRNGKGLDNR